ncbi:PREDICTED: 39S ribosomal protein L10, mitochondrial-like [Priapulus caudatus]|uniref:Large ribosomal subunit protein uL10m n=1 Tax=Priapulus caudatus TaxID=37621 RepID=A0ABM1DPU6_PRICU|nr:PREDICTED: 39S ribosomal protein L10, mitochondrial-like [Priapulus caudatus]XP_014661968.1 PREDICTED: 39S ribosomal protein L10, mitochondrial-like [Priapulus caudatus]XP_014661969.1 PREDICTED: 39S ribosomal protein L10, mitochondrial-like [Priapulus caudatus]XP_014661970.1 PREDICTED: 39S ribosomal protein L10, mitochondrial-like [Priapulus caudatus]
MASVCSFRPIGLYVTRWAIVRHTGKPRIGVKETHRPHIKRGQIIKMAEPVYPEDIRVDAERCTRRRKLIEMITEKNTKPTQYEAFLAGQVYKTFEENELVAVFHKMPVSNRDFYAIRLQLHKAGFATSWFNSKVLRCAVTDTKYANLLPLFTSMCVLVSCKESKVGELIKNTRRQSNLYLLGGVVDKQIVSLADMKRYMELSSMDSVRSQLCAILNMAASRTTNLLSSHQSQLSRNLEQYVKQETAGSTEESDGGKS